MHGFVYKLGLGLGLMTLAMFMFVLMQIASMQPTTDDDVWTQDQIALVQTFPDLSYESRRTLCQSWATEPDLGYEVATQTYLRDMNVNANQWYEAMKVNCL